MTDKFEIIDPLDEKLREQLDKIDWPIYHGNIRLQIRWGEVTLIAIERTIKNDKNDRIRR